MKLLTPEQRYYLTESLRLLGVRGVIKICIALWLAFWLFWPEAETAPQPLAPAAIEAKKTVPQDPLPPPSTVTKDDLRPQMTAAQSRYYWDSFVWMMEHGKPLAPKAMQANALYVRYLKDAPFKAENGLECQPYSEELSIAGKTNQRQGIGCRKALHHWCRQVVGEKAQCRLPEGGSVSTDSDMTLHNLKTDWNRNLYRWSF
jgi:hypothetical protein